MCGGLYEVQVNKITLLSRFKILKWKFSLKVFLLNLSTTSGKTLYYFRLVKKTNIPGNDAFSRADQSRLVRQKCSGRIFADNRKKKTDPKRDSSRRRDIISEEILIEISFLLRIFSIIKKHDVILWFLLIQHYLLFLYCNVINQL